MRPMRRKNQQLDDARCRGILERGRECVLALAGSDATDGFPYAVPVNYAYLPAADDENDDALGHLIIHCAPVGAKLDAVAADARVSACVIERADVVPEKLTTYFVSVIAFGRAHLVTDDAERRAALVALADKYAPELAAEAVDGEIERFFPRVTIIDVVLEQVTGKQCIELVGKGVQQ